MERKENKNKAKQNTLGRDWNSRQQSHAKCQHEGTPNEERLIQLGRRV
jgi:hypothetical protein